MCNHTQVNFVNLFILIRLVSFVIVRSMLVIHSSDSRPRDSDPLCAATAAAPHSSPRWRFKSTLNSMRQTGTIINGANHVHRRLARSPRARSSRLSARLPNTRSPWRRQTITRVGSRRGIWTSRRAGETMDTCPRVKLMRAMRRTIQSRQRLVVDLSVRMGEVMMITALEFACAESRKLGSA